MNVYQFEHMSLDPDEVMSHVNHEVEIVTYGDPPQNLAIECFECSLVIGDIEIVATEKELLK